MFTGTCSDRTRGLLLPLQPPDAVKRLYRWRGRVVNELAYPVRGSHALFLPQRHLARIYEASWNTSVDGTIFRTLQAANGRVSELFIPSWRNMPENIDLCSQPQTKTRDKLWRSIKS